MKRYLVGYHYPDSETVYTYWSVEDDAEAPTEEFLATALTPVYPDYGAITIDSLEEAQPFVEAPQQV
jgi:hypothetical protein